MCDKNHGLGHLPQPNNFTTVGNSLGIEINQYNCPIQVYPSTQSSPLWGSAWALRSTSTTAPFRYIPVHSLQLFELLLLYIVHSHLLIGIKLIRIRPQEFANSNPDLKLKNLQIFEFFISKNGKNLKLALTSINLHAAMFIFL